MLFWFGWLLLLLVVVDVGCCLSVVGCWLLVDGMVVVVAVVFVGMVVGAAPFCCC